MTLLALKHEVSTNKMLKTSTNPRLRRSNAVGNSFGSCIPNASKKLSRAPEMSFWEISSEPRMLLHEHPRRVSLKKLKSPANAHGWRKLNKEMDMVNSDVEFVNLKSPSVSDLPQEKFTIHFEPVKFERVHCIFNFPDKMESILSEAVFSGFQIHFLSPKSATRKRAHANFAFSFEEPSISAPHIKNSKKLNFEDGDSSQNLKVWVSSPWM